MARQLRPLVAIYTASLVTFATQSQATNNDFAIPFAKPFNLLWKRSACLFFVAKEWVNLQFSISIRISLIIAKTIVEQQSHLHCIHFTKNNGSYRNLRYGKPMKTAFPYQEN